MQLVVINHTTLDGVMQGPGRTDEDTRDGFEHGGWAEPRSTDPDIGAVLSSRMTRSDGLLLGRRTYDDLLASWNAQGGPFKDALNGADKYVASRARSAQLPWPNSTMVGPDVVAAVADLKDRPGRELHIMGSGELVASLLPHGLIDEFLLIVHPIVLGSGRRLFPVGGRRIDLQLVDATRSKSGAIITTLRSIVTQT